MKTYSELSRFFRSGGMLLIQAFILSGFFAGAFLYGGDGDFVRAGAMGGTSQDEGYGVYVDVYGYVYTTGNFEGTADFDPGPGVFSLTSAGSTDIFISKLDRDGNFVWAGAMGGTSHDYGKGIAADRAGNVYITGYFCSATADFDPGPGIFNLASSGAYDLFISKLDINGNLVWAKAIGGTANDSGFGISLDGSGHLFITGSFAGTVDFDPGQGTFNLTAAGDIDVFVGKFDGDGNFAWAGAMGGTSMDRGHEISLDASGNVYATGFFSSATADFDPGPGTFNLTCAGGYDVFISKLDGNGNFVWARAMGGTLIDTGYGVSVDGSGNVYTTGIFQDTADFDPGTTAFNLTAAGSYDLFISKLDGNGEFAWARAAGGTSMDRGHGISLDGSGNVYVTGYFYGTVDFDPGPGAFNLTSAGGSDIFIVKFDGDGNFVWARAIGGGSSDSGNCIFADGAGNVYAAGHFSGTADFDPGPGTFNLSSAGSYEIFVVSLKGGRVIPWIPLLLSDE